MQFAWICYLQGRFVKNHSPNYADNNLLDYYGVSVRDGVVSILDSQDSLVCARIIFLTRKNKMVVSKDRLDLRLKLN